MNERLELLLDRWCLWRYARRCRKWRRLSARKPWTLRVGRFSLAVGDCKHIAGLLVDLAQFGIGDRIIARVPGLLAPTPDSDPPTYQIIRFAGREMLVAGSTYCSRKIGFAHIDRLGWCPTLCNEFSIYKIR